MKKITKHTIIFALITSFLVSCTKDFDELNTDQTKITEVDNASLDFVFSAAQYRGIFGSAPQYQLFAGLYSDLQAQYFATTQKNFASDRNLMVGRWIDGSWTNFYSNANSQMDVVLENTKLGGKLQNPIKHAIAKIWRVSMFMPITDNWGAVPYFQAGNGKTEVLYDSQQDIYKDFFKTLKEATDVLRAYTGTEKFFAKGDLIYGGDPKKWLRFGNSLRLRAAMRISKIDPVLAKAEAEAAVTAGGLLISNADNANVAVSLQSTNPLGAYSNLNEFRMSATMESILKGYSDPRQLKFFAPAATGGGFKGLRNGMSISQMSEATNSINVSCGINATNTSASTPTTAKENEAKTPWTVFNAAETYFLLAEGALNGWNMGAGTAASFYNLAIAASLNQWGITGTAVTTYQNSTSTPSNYSNGVYSTPALITVPVLFAATPATQREQIGTQKWISLFPYSSEAWAEVRRTGFPKLFPRLNTENLDSPASDPLSVRRVTYPPVEAAVNAGGLASGLAKLGGPDKSSTKLWWDQ